MKKIITKLEAGSMGIFFPFFSTIQYNLWGIPIISWYVVLSKSLILTLATTYIVFWGTHIIFSGFAMRGYNWSVNKPQQTRNTFLIIDIGMILALFVSIMLVAILTINKPVYNSVNFLFLVYTIGIPATLTVITKVFFK